MDAFSVIILRAMALKKRGSSAVWFSRWEGLPVLYTHPLFIKIYLMQLLSVRQHVRLSHWAFLLWLAARRNDPGSENHCAWATSLAPDMQVRGAGPVPGLGVPCRDGLGKKCIPSSKPSCRMTLRKASALDEAWWHVYSCH